MLTVSSIAVDGTNRTTRRIKLPGPFDVPDRRKTDAAAPKEQSCRSFQASQHGFHKFLSTASLRQQHIISAKLKLFESKY
jgi:hypothetical protein